jgi:hypothetical protein
MEDRVSLIHAITTALSLMTTLVQTLEEVCLDCWPFIPSLTVSFSCIMALQIPAGRVCILHSSNRSLLTGPQIHPCLGRRILGHTATYLCYYHEAGYTDS